MIGEVRVDTRKHAVHVFLTAFLSDCKKTEKTMADVVDIQLSKNSTFSFM